MRLSMYKMLGAPIHARLLRTRRRFCEASRIFKYSHAGYIDFLRQHLPVSSPGSFLEAGAHDGWTGSNTYTLEAVHGWRGILVEPVPELFRECRRNRPKARVFQCALGAKAGPAARIDIFPAGLVSTVSGSPLLSRSREAAKAYYQQDMGEAVSVPLKTIDSLILESGLTSLDFLALDVEGFEAEALAGVNFDERAPRYILVEANFPEKIINILENRYRVVAAMGDRDILYTLR
jgi:FkbM family methyltransferase